MVADGLHQVGLAETRTAMNEERIVTRPLALGHRFASRVGELAIRADHEGIEGVVGVEAGRLQALLEARVATHRCGGCGLRRRFCGGIIVIAGRRGLHSRQGIFHHQLHSKRAFHRFAHRGVQLGHVVGLDPHEVDLVRNRDHRPRIFHGHQPRRTEPPLERILAHQTTQCLTNANPLIHLRDRLHPLFRIDLRLFHVSHCCRFKRFSVSRWSLGGGRGRRRVVARSGGLGDSFFTLSNRSPAGTLFHRRSTIF
jgi:hypothetical protein